MTGIVLFADNKVFAEGNENKLFNIFLQKKEYSVLPINNLACLESTIKSASTFKACIIDWNFENEGNDDEDFAGVQHPQRTPVSILQEYPLYTLVYIYSEKDISDSEKSLLIEKFGGKIKFKTKGNNVEEEYKTISMDIIKFESDNTHMGIPFLWSQSINQSTQTIFRELENADPFWIKEIRDTTQNDGGDATSEVIGVFNNLLSENLIQDKSLRGVLDRYSPEGVVTKEENTAKLYRRIYYSKITPTIPLSTGDIFKFDEDTYGIIITPECELSDNSKEKNKEYYDFLIIKKSHSEKYQKEKQATYKKDQSSAKSIFNNGVISRHVLTSFPFDDKTYNQIGLIDFNTAFRTIEKINKKQESVISYRTNYKLNAPYIHQLRQRFVAYFGKYGVPAIPDSLRNYNLK